MLQYGLSKVHEVIIKKYTKDDEFMATAQKTRGIKFDYDMELYDDIGTAVRESKR
jgi:hypothetical protein